MEAHSGNQVGRRFDLEKEAAEAVSQREYVIAVTLIYDKLAHSEKLPNDHDCLSL